MYLPNIADQSEKVMESAFIFDQLYHPYLEVNGTPARRRSQIYLQLSQKLLVLGDPVAQDVSVVSWDDRYLCKEREV